MEVVDAGAIKLMSTIELKYITAESVKIGSENRRLLTPVSKQYLKLDSSINA